MKKHTLLIDMDSVITDLMSKWFRVYNEAYNDRLTVDQLTGWNTHHKVKKECGSKIYEFLEQPGFYRDLQPLPQSIEVIERLNEKYDIFIVTTSPINAFKDKTEWIVEYLPFIGAEKIIFTHYKNRIKGDLLFDDAPHNLISFQEEGGISVAMDYPYNRDVNCRRVTSWLQFEASVEQWLKE